MMEVKEIEISKLKPWQENPRLNDHAVDAIAKSIQTFGFNVPILYDQNFIIVAGHTRWKAAKKLGMTQVPAIMLNLNDIQRKAFSIADNKLASLAEWDQELEMKIIEELKMDNIDLPCLGFSEAELQALLIPEQDLNWEEFSESLGKGEDPIYAVIQIKIKQELRDKIMDSIKQYAVDHGFQDKNSAFLAGRVLCHLLELSQ